MQNISDIELSVIIPIYNEVDNIPELYNRLNKIVNLVSKTNELIFINDGSKDNSLMIIKQLSIENKNIKFINLSRNFGHQIAVSAGLDLCKGNAVVIIDADLQDPPELIKDMMKKYHEGYDVVYAKRIKRKGESWFKKMTAKIFYRILKKITSINIPVDTGDFRLINRKIVDCLKQMPEQNKFLRGQIAWLGFKQTFIEFEREERKRGTTGYPFSKMLKFALDGITSFSDKPLNFVTQAGIVVSLLSFIVIIYSLYGYYINGKNITGWTSIIISVLFLGGVQLISVGIIGLYISRINKNIINRPLYLIQETNC